MGISLTTFYKYENELNLPRLTVAIGNTSSHLPYQQAMRAFNLKFEQYELLLLRHVAQFVGARIKLAPKCVLGREAESAVLEESVDFAMASLSWTEQRAQRLYFSDTYLLDSTPNGVLLAMKNGWPHSRIGKTKPVLAVARDSVHSEFAEKKLRQEFSIKLCRNFVAAAKAVSTFNADVMLMNDRFIPALAEELKDMHIVSKPYFYDSYTTMLFHKNSSHWIPHINNALSIVHERKLVPTETEFTTGYLP